MQMRLPWRMMKPSTRPSEYLKTLPLSERAKFFFWKVWGALRKSRFFGAVTFQIYLMYLQNFGQDARYIKAALKSASTMNVSAKADADGNVEFARRVEAPKAATVEVGSTAQWLDYSGVMQLPNRGL